MKKTVVIACGTGIATSTMVHEAVETLLKKNKIPAELIQCKVSEIDAYLDQADLIITSMKVKKDYGKPMVTAVAFISGIGKEAVEEEILNILK